jgi:hypothetical protein
MARYQLIEDATGNVVNVIEWDGNEAGWQPPPGYSAVLDDPDTIWTYDGEKYVPFVSPEQGPLT